MIISWRSLLAFKCRIASWIGEMQSRLTGLDATPEGTDATLCRMIALRRRTNPVFRRGPRPSNWPALQLRHTPEFIIFSLAHYVALLERDGLTEHQALARIDGALGLCVLPPRHEPRNLSQYLSLVLARHQPDYLTHGAKLLNAAVALAQGHFEGAGSQSGQGYPPQDWLGPIIEPQHFREEYTEHLSLQDLLFPKSTFDAELADFLVRWQEGDELRSFSSPSVAWQAMMGSAGVALVRDGRPIAHLEAMMN